MPDKKTRKLQLETRAIGWGILSSVARRRLVALLVIGVIIMIVGAVAIKQNNKKKNGEEAAETLTGMQVGQYYEKQKQCYMDEDCPDNTYCNSMGLCVSTDGVPLVQARPVLGRGRAGEGGVLRVSKKLQGQE